MLFKLLILLIIFIVIFTIIGRIRFNSKASQERLAECKKEKQDWFKNHSGRAEGRILEHHWDTFFTSGVRDGSSMKEDTIDSTDSVFMVTYEFEVNGQTYTGKGEGSPSFQAREKQTICYDPSDPNDNCTLYYYNGQAHKADKVIIS